MDSRHHCNDCPHWYVTQKKYPSGYYKITLCKKYNEQLYYLAGEENQSPHPCNTCSKRFSYMPYIEKKIRGDGRMAERLSDNNPCKNCKIDQQIGNPNRWECECSRCDKPNDWKNECVKKLAEYETAEKEGRLVVLPCKVGGYVYTNIKPNGFYLRKNNIPYQCFVEFIVMSHDPIVKVLYPNGYDYVFNFSDFKKAVFLTREEAEKALKEMEGK